MRVSRFIPAGAGNTSTNFCSGNAIAVYPRWRGEHGLQIGPIHGLIGLSPLARGTQPVRSLLLMQHRFIPAGAGNTSRAISSSTTPQVYPRWRGEHLLPTHNRGIAYGLSPLARGTHVHQSEFSIPWRFIPAGAGNTLLFILCISLISVYPRWRGEHFEAISIADCQCGLSPLARGTPTAMIDRELKARFIPAGAGNTLCISDMRGQLPVYPRWRGEHPKKTAA